MFLVSRTTAGLRHAALLVPCGVRDAEYLREPLLPLCGRQHQLHGVFHRLCAQLRRGDGPFHGLVDRQWVRKTYTLDLRALWSLSCSFLFSHTPSLTHAAAKRGAGVASLS